MNQDYISNSLFRAKSIASKALLQISSLILIYYCFDRTIERNDYFALTQGSHIIPWIIVLSALGVFLSSWVSRTFLNSIYSRLESVFIYNIIFTLIIIYAIMLLLGIKLIAGKGICLLIFAISAAWMFVTVYRLIITAVVKRALAVAFLPFMFMFTIFTLFGASFVSTTGDEPHYLMITHSLLNEGDINQMNNYQGKDYENFYWQTLVPKPSDITGASYIYSQGLGVLFPALLIPGYAIGSRLGACLMMSVVAALLGVTLLRLGEKATGDFSAAYWGTVILMASIPFQIFSYQIYPEIVAAWLACVCYLFIMGRLSFIRSAAFILLTGIMVLMKIRFAPLAGTLWLLFLWQLYGRKKVAFIIAGILCLGGAVSLVIADALFFRSDLVLNRFGTFFQIRKYLPDSQTLVGALGVLLDQEAGLFPYAPIYLLAFYGLCQRKLFSGKHWWGLVLIIALNALVVASHPMWHSAPTPIGRYSLSYLPFAGILVIGAMRVRGSFHRIIQLLLVVPGFLSSGAMLLWPNWRANHADGTAVLLESVARSLNGPIYRFFPSLIRKPWEQLPLITLAIVFCTALLVIYAGARRTSLLRNMVGAGAVLCLLLFGSLWFRLSDFIIPIKVEVEDTYTGLSDKLEFYPLNKDPYFHHEADYGISVHPGGVLEVSFNLSEGDWYNVVLRVKGDGERAGPIPFQIVHEKEIVDTHQIVVHAWRYYVSPVVLPSGRAKFRIYNLKKGSGRLIVDKVELRTLDLDVGHRQLLSGKKWLALGFTRLAEDRLYEAVKSGLKLSDAKPFLLEALKSNNKLLEITGLIWRPRDNPWLQWRVEEQWEFGLALIQAGLYIKALSVFEEIPYQYKHNEHTWFYLGLVEALRENYRRTLECFSLLPQIKAYDSFSPSQLLVDNIEIRESVKDQIESLKRDQKYQGYLHRISKEKGEMAAEALQHGLWKDAAMLYYEALWLAPEYYYRYLPVNNGDFRDCVYPLIPQRNIRVIRHLRKAFRVLGTE